MQLSKSSATEVWFSDLTGPRIKPISRCLGEHITPDHVLFNCYLKNKIIV